jgi:hypothetical protein
MSDSKLNNKGARIIREKKTIGVMISLYCHANHSQRNLCPECSRLLDYSLARLDKCPFQDGKTTCGKCPVHCYRGDMREKIRAVMRYSGPRMIFRHPGSAIMHLFDGMRKNPVRSRS